MDELLKYDGLIYNIIGKYINYFDKDDLYQVAMIGLINAKKHFNSKKNTKFTTYAYYYILGEVNKYIRESNEVKISRELIKLDTQVEKAKILMTQRIGREPTNIELSLYLEIPEEKIEEVEKSKLIIKSLDYTSNEIENNLYNYIEINDKNMDSDIIDLKMALENLSKEEQKLIKYRYFDDYTQSETSKKLGESQVQISRKEAKILQKLRTRL